MTYKIKDIDWSKLKILGYCAKKDRGSWKRQNEYYLSPNPDENYTVPVISISDYEALQADYERLLKHLQNLIDQPTPLEPESGNPMWSRRIQLDEVIEERDRLQAECEKLAEALESIMEYVPLSVVQCRGDKCRELWCASCYGEEEAESNLATAVRRLRNAKTALISYHKGVES